MDLVEKARVFATEKHKNQTRKNKVTPYIIHPEGVVQLLISEGITDENIICAAWLHDTVEDTECTSGDLRLEFNETIAYYVKVLTRTKSDSRQSYLERIISSEPEIKLIKLADVVHNSRDLDPLRKDHIQRIVLEIKDTYLPLAEQTNYNFYKKLSENIKKYGVIR